MSNIGPDFEKHAKQHLRARNLPSLGELAVDITRQERQAIARALRRLRGEEIGKDS